MDSTKGEYRAFRISEVCAKTGLGRTTLYAAIKSGALRARKCGRRTLILARDLDEWLGTLPIK
jgi:excisionase family DNA binding protein